MELKTEYTKNTEHRKTNIQFLKWEVENADIHKPVVNKKMTTHE